MESDHSHSKKVQEQYRQEVFKVDFSRLSRQGTTQEYMEENIEETDRKVEDDLDRNEEGSRSRGVVRHWVRSTSAKTKGLD